MIPIQISNIKDIEARYIKRIEGSIKRNKLKKVEKKQLGIKSFSLGSELQKRISKLYTCSPDKLIQENNNFEQYLNSLNYSAHKKSYLKNKYFNYSSVISYTESGEKNSYWLMNQLNIKVCPYCNRSYTFTIDSENGICRPEFDHFYDKATYPYIALSFYNLIPSCPTCNHRKGNDVIDINPYSEGFGDNCKFNIDKIEKCILDSQSFGLWTVDFLKGNKKFNSNIKTFLLHEFYNQHKDYIAEIVYKALAYNSGYYNSLIETFTKQGLSEKEMKLMIFGNYIDEEDLGNRPLSKLTKDIIEQIGLDL
jgi:hypothetical protein